MARSSCRMPAKIFADSGGEVPSRNAVLLVVALVWLNLAAPSGRQNPGRFKILSELVLLACIDQDAGSNWLVPN